MKKAVSLLLAAVILVSLCACGRTYRINVPEKSQSLLESWPDKAKAGETVTLKTMCVEDGEIVIAADGAEDGAFTDNTHYTFTMPDRDVTVKVKISTDGYAGS